jgi:murein L,D-transpeptidase YafK
MPRSSVRNVFWWGLVAVGVLIATIAVSHLQRSAELPLTASADRVVVIKHEHLMMLMRDGRALKTYRVALGRGGIGPKVRAGDNKVPEGVYPIAGRNAQSAFHRALRVGYPTPQQVRDAQRRGVDPGGDIMIHGIRNGLGWVGPLQRYVDWTKGCIALTDGEMDEVWRAVPDGTPIEIKP